MSKYHLNQTSKTRFFNFFRRLFTIPLFEKILVKMTLNNSSKFLQKLIPPDYLYKKNSFRYVTREGVNYKFDISNMVDHYVYYGIDHYYYYEDSSYASILETLKSAKVIIDIGANIGTTALYYASLNSNAQILAFEPHPDTFNRANENIQLNNFQNIQLINTGLGEKKDTLKLYEVNENNPGMNRILSEDTNLPFKIIEVDTLDSIMFDKKITKVDFIKIDVEGFEYAVLTGGANTIIKSKPILFIELDDNNLRNNNKTAKELVDKLISFGYKEIYRADNLMPITTHDDFNNCHYDIIAK